MYTLTKDFRFESAHRLIKGYVGKCSNVHGHSWNGHISIERLSLDEHDMAVDYKIMGASLKEIEDYYDHKLIVCASDEKLIQFCRINNSAFVTTRGNPTCEVIAQEIFQVLKKILMVKLPSCRLQYVEIRETCTTTCRYTEL